MSEDLLKASEGRPSVVATIICSDVIEDKTTNNKTVVNIFNAIGFQQLPAVYHKLVLFVVLQDGQGAHDITISIRKPSGGKVLEITGKLDLPNSKDTQDIVMNFNDMPIEEVGTYFVDIIVDGSPLAYRRFEVVQQGAPS